MNSVQQQRREQEQQYVGVEWRLDVPLGCRSVPKPTTAAPPQFVIALDTVPVSLTSSSTGVDTATPAGSHASEMREDGAVQRQFFSCDYETTVNISKALEEACGSLWSTQYRRVNKMVK
jgi:hypothetical protein